MIENEIQTFFLIEAQKEWNSLLKSWNSRPWGIWIREYETAPPDSSGFRSSNVPKTVWFLDEKGFRIKNSEEFQRFIIVQSGLYWNELAFNSIENKIWSGRDGIFHEIGLASFAKIERTENKYYFDYIWGGRFARGRQADLSRGFENAVWKDIWVS